MNQKNVDLCGLNTDTRKLINQALNLALANAAELPTMFAIYGERNTPTLAEVAHTTEVLRSTINDQVVYYGTESLLVDTFNSIIWSIECWIDSRPASQTIGEAFDEYSSRYGIDMSELNLHKLKCFTRCLCPHASIGITYDISDKHPEHLEKCKQAMQKLFITEPVHDYGQDNVGIVVDGVMYDFPREHPLVEQLKHLVNIQR